MPIKLMNIKGPPKSKFATSDPDNRINNTAFVCEIIPGISIPNSVEENKTNCHQKMTNNTF